MGALARDAMGIGLRPVHYGEVDEGGARVDFFEIIVDNYIGVAELPRRRLRAIAQRHPLVGHGVALNLLGADPLDEEYLGRVKRLVESFELPYVTDHLCWTASEEVHHHDLLPAPHHPELIDYAIERAARVQAFLGVPFGLENLSSYVTWSRDQMPEWEFYRRVVEGADCHYMLDVNNIVVSAHNHGFDPHDYLDAIDWSRVLQVHVAGHGTLDGGLRHDTHDREVSDEVWALYREAWQRGGPFPTVLEWDQGVPSIEVMATQLDRARRVRTRAEEGEVG